EELRRRHPGARVVASHEVAPEFREFERASTTAVDAYLGPAVSRYLEALRGAAETEGLPEPLVMRSSGGVATLAEAAGHPALVLVSGPAAGVIGAARLARLAGIENAISLDMGGTSTDVCLIAGGEAGRSAEREVAGLPLRLPMVDLQPVGAGSRSEVRRGAGGGWRAVGARARSERRAARPRRVVRVPARGGRRAAGRGRGGSALSGAVVRAYGAAGRRPRRRVSPCARGPLRLRGPGAGGRARGG